MANAIIAVAFGLGTTELLIILAILMFVFGASKIPELGKSLGQGIRGFQKSMKEEDEQDLLEDNPVKEAQTAKLLEDQSVPATLVETENVTDVTSEPVPVATAVETANAKAE